MQSRLIIINGACGIGKSTLAQRYIDDHPMALHLKIDEIIAMLGQWEKDESVSRTVAIEYAQHIARMHLRKGYDVVLPYIFTSSHIAESFEKIAKEENVMMYEFVLIAEKKESVARMLARGTWGESGAPPLTKKDIPIIEELYDAMERTLVARPNAIKIPSLRGEIDATYKSLEEYLSTTI